MRSRDIEKIGGIAIVFTIILLIVYFAVKFLWLIGLAVLLAVIYYYFFKKR